MREKKYHLYLTADEQSKVIQSLIDLKNNLIAQGHEQSFRLHTPNLRPVPKFREDESVVSICIEPMQNRNNDKEDK